VKGSPSIGKSKQNRRRLMNGLRLELGPGSAIDYAWVWSR